jgi:hypothetical protein
MNESISMKLVKYDRNGQHFEIKCNFSIAKIEKAMAKINQNFFEIINGVFKMKFEKKENNLSGRVK